jgi:glycosyltransferase involved in cell wall biosynthesis
MIPTLAIGGAERVLITILRHLDRTRFNPALAVLDTRNAVFLDELPTDVELIDLQCTRVRYALPKLTKLIWQRRPDVVLSTLGQLNLAIAMLRPLLPRGIRYLARETVVVSADADTKKWPRFWRLAHRHSYRRFDALICQSRDMQEDLVQQFAVPAEKTVVINNPVDAGRIRELSKMPPAAEESADTKDSLHVVSVGRLTHQKGFDMLIDALALCARPSLRITIIGDGPLRKDLEQRAMAKGVADQVRFVGFQKNPYPFVAQADVFVLSSRYEGFPNAVLESLACGTPVIALPAAGGVREILGQVPGCVIAEEITAASLAKAIGSFSFGVRVDPAVVERYSTQNITRLYEQEFLKE